MRLVVGARTSRQSLTGEVGQIVVVHRVTFSRSNLG